MANPFTAHPASVGETYGQHFAFALRFGLRMAGGGLAAIVHAFLPFVFVTTAGRISDELVRMRTEQLEIMRVVRLQIPKADSGRLVFLHDEECRRKAVDLTEFGHRQLGAGLFDRHGTGLQHDRGRCLAALGDTDDLWRPG